MASTAMASAPHSVPSSMNLRAMSWTPGATPTTPSPSSEAAIVPATCVPCQSSAGVVDGVVVVAEVPAVDVVDVAVVVVIDRRWSPGAGLARVRPGAVGEVGMAEVDAVVDDRDDDRRTRRCVDAQRLEAVDVDVGDARLVSVPLSVWPVLWRPHGSSKSGSVGDVDRPARGGGSARRRATRGSSASWRRTVAGERPRRRRPRSGRRRWLADEVSPWSRAIDASLARRRRRRR